MTIGIYPNPAVRVYANPLDNRALHGGCGAVDLHDWAQRGGCGAVDLQDRALRGGSGVADLQDRASALPYELRGGARALHLHGEHQAQDRAFCEHDHGRAFVEHSSGST